MTIRTNDQLMTSDITPETATRLTALAWELSWLPGRTLTWDTAYGAMVLDEILSDADQLYSDDGLAMEIATMRAADLGLTLRQAMQLLYERILARDAQCRPPTSAAATPVAG